MEACFESCLAFTRAEEGGYVDDARDSGNWSGGQVGQGRLIGSNMGVGAPTLVAWMGPQVYVTAEQMRDLQPATYSAIATARYWQPTGSGNVPAGFDLMLFDFGWNRGVSTSLDLLAKCLALADYQTGPMTPGLIDEALLKIPRMTLLEQIPKGGIMVLQRLLDVSVDGVVGPKTLDAFSVRQDLRATAGLLALAAAQVVSYKKLSNFSTYGAGWLARTARRQVAALALGKTTTSSTVTLYHEKSTRTYETTHHV